MNWNYENYIITELISLQSQMGLSDFNFEIETEEAFVKREDYNENTIYIIIKYLSDDKTSGAVIQPVQFLILSEQDQLDVAKAIFDKFATDHNFVAVIESTEYIKQQYTNPVVLSNFNPVMYGYRSVMYMTSNLYILTAIIDFKKITVKTVDMLKPIELHPLSLSLSYSMTTNTQQIKTEQIASSVKSASSLSISMNIPLQNNSFVNRVLNTINETRDGNLGYTIALFIALGSDATPIISVSMKLISAQITTGINQVPGLQVGLMK